MKSLNVYKVLLYYSNVGSGNAIEAKSQWHSVMQPVNYSICNCNHKALFLRVRNYNGIWMALMEFRWQYYHTKFIIKLQDVIFTGLYKFEISLFVDWILLWLNKWQYLNGAVFVLIFLRYRGIFQADILGFIFHKPEEIAVMGFLSSACSLTMILKFYLLFNYDLLANFPLISEFVHLLEIKRFPEKIRTGI